MLIGPIAEDKCHNNLPVSPFLPSANSRVTGRTRSRDRVMNLNGRYPYPCVKIGVSKKCSIKGREFEML